MKRKRKKTQKNDKKRWKKELMKESERRSKWKKKGKNKRKRKEWRNEKRKKIAFLFLFDFFFLSVNIFLGFLYSFISIFSFLQDVWKRIKEKMDTTKSKYLRGKQKRIWRERKLIGEWKEERKKVKQKEERVESRELSFLSDPTCGIISNSAWLLLGFEKPFQNT